MTSVTNRRRGKKNFNHFNIFFLFFVCNLESADYIISRNNDQNIWIKDLWQKQFFTTE